MAISLNNYLLDQTGLEWSTTLSPWAWLLPAEVTVWFANRFADLFLVLQDGTVHLLDVGGGALERVAESRDDFHDLIDQDDNADLWLMIPLVDQLVAAGVLLAPGQCYGFKTPPVLGGEYTVENCGPLSAIDYLGAYGSIHQQMRDLPDGTRVVLKVDGAQVDLKVPDNPD